MCGPAPEADAMPNVKTDEPATPRAEPKSIPAFHQMISENPKISRATHKPNRVTMEAGPTKERTRSRSS